MNLPDHFDVLRGTSGQAPTIPVGAHTLGVNRRNFSTSADAWQSLQRNCTFENVFEFPEQYSGVHILNQPVVARNDTSTPSNASIDESRNNLYVCDYENCNYVGKSAQALRMHKRKGHGVKNENENVNYVCNFEKCRYVGKNALSLRMHKIKCHVTKQKPRVKTSHKEVRQLQATVTDENDAESVTFAETSSICVDRVATNSKDQTVNDANSVCSRDSNGSRRSERIARKRASTFTDSQSQCYVSSKARRLSDVNDRGLWREAKTCSTDKTRGQSVVHANENVDVEPDNASVNCAMSTDSTLRRSVRIANRQRKFEVEKQKSSVSKNSDNAVTDLSNKLMEKNPEISHEEIICSGNFTIREEIHSERSSATD